MSELANRVEAALATAVSETLEGMAFESVDLAPEPPEAVEDEGERLWVSLEIINPYSGRVIIELPAAYAETVARAMYGETEEKIPDDVINDTLAELSNTLAGRFMLELLGSQKDYALGFPITSRGDCPLLEERATTQYFTGSGHHLTVTVTGVDFKRLTQEVIVQNAEVVI